MSKSHKARTIPLLDGRVAERMRERLEGLDGPDYVFEAAHDARARMHVTMHITNDIA